MFSALEYEQAIGRMYMEGLSVQSVLNQMQVTITAKEKENTDLLTQLEDVRQKLSVFSQTHDK